MVDDGSVPPVEHAVFQDAPTELKTLLVRNEASVGAPAARNIGVKHADSEWIAFLDDDDRFFPGKIEAVGQLIQQYPDTDLVYHPALIRMVREKVEYVSGAEDLAASAEPDQELLVRNLVGGTSMVVVRKSCFLKVGGFDDSMAPIEDWELYIRFAAEKARFRFIPEPLCLYFHDSQISSLTKDLKKQEGAILRLKEKHARAYGLLGRSQVKAFDANVLRSVAFKALLNRQPWPAFKGQLKVFLFTMGMKDLLVLMLIPFGNKAVFFVRSLARRYLHG